MKGFIAAILSAALIFPMSAKALDADREAKRLLERISGSKVSGDNRLLPRIKRHIQASQWDLAAEVAMEHPDFLNITVKQMAQKMSTREESINAPFSDFVATFIGIVRDNLDGRSLLTGDFQYIGNKDRVPTGMVLRSEYNAHIVKSNDHYADLESLKIDLGHVLMPIKGQLILQSRTDTVVYNPDPGGVLTSRAFLSAHTTAGTNRRPVEFTFRQFMCTPIEQWADTAVSDARIGRDIDRYPGGDHTRFQVSCKGCHTVMDGYRGAFAKWNLSNNFVSNRDAQIEADGRVTGGVEAKLNGNSNVFPNGFVTVDNSFVNNARGPANAELFGWRGNVDGGNGVKDFGRIVANSSRFSECMVKRVFESVCRREISFDTHKQFLKHFAESFEKSNYSFKSLYKSVAVTEECVR